MSTYQTALSPEALALLKSMGFPESDATVALMRCNNDVNMAVELLSNGLAPDDAEFDLLAMSEPQPSVHDPTVFQPRSHNDQPDHFAEGVTGGTIGEMVDSRISSLTQMGFSAAEAEQALNQCNGDVNDALNILLSK